MSFLESLTQSLTTAGPWAALLLGVVVVLDLALAKRARAFWTFAPAFALLLAGGPWWSWLGAAAIGGVLVTEPIRRFVATAPVLEILRALKFLPKISDTEREALEAGTIWVDGELFSGRPDFDRLLTESWPRLSAEEQAFLDGPVEEVCRMTDDWDVNLRRDLSAETWAYLKKERFFGMIIPKEFGGLGFSAFAHSAVIAKLSSRSQTLAISVMVPNSLGPAELLLHHGTPEQKTRYLPRLATGDEMPCFALTEPGAGSDAGGMSSHGEVFRGDDGELYLRLTWNKRYITLASISTVLGLAFKLRDPENLLGKGTDPGITCALIPSDTEGVEIGRRHDPLGIPFYNCPTTGEGVVVPASCIIGGNEGAGRGWLMLMASLAAGRGISLPAASTGAAKLVARVAGAHAAVRKQFGLPIGRFEGIEEPLARIAGTTWLLEAARRYTCGGIDSGAKPAVITAMAKYQFTESFRRVINDGMDVVAGNGISRGPRNLLAAAYAATPVMITVEGANILTRTLVVFGQGAIRCHPHAYAEIQAAAEGDLARFDREFWGHVVHVLRNGCRALVLSLTRGLLGFSPIGGPSARYLRRLAWASASFAFFADVAMGTLGGDLKRKEKLTGRFADVFSWMYLATAGIRRFEADGRPKEQLPFLCWSCETALAEIQRAFDGIFRNWDVPVIGLIFRGPVALWSRFNRFSSGPSDALGAQVAQALQLPGALREELTDGLFIPEDENEALGRLERAFRLCTEADALISKAKKAGRKNKWGRLPVPELVAKAVEEGVLSADDADLVREAEAARDDAVQVDAFDLEDYARSAVQPTATVAVDAPAKRVP
jgi:acyl-CoA dehydrogenase